MPQRDRFPAENFNSELFTSREKQAHEHAARWLMLAVTRAIDTLVLEISSDDGYIHSKLAEAARACGETVTWVKL